MHSQWKAVFELKRWRQGKVNARVFNPPQVAPPKLNSSNAAFSHNICCSRPWYDNNFTAKNSNSHRLKQTVKGQGQTVNNQSRPFKCQLSRKQVQNWRILTLAEQPRSCRLATPKNNSAPGECHPVEPHCSTEPMKAAIQANWGGRRPWKEKKYHLMV